MRRRAGIEEQRSHPLGERRAARLAREDHVDAPLGQGRDQQLACVDLPEPSPPSNVMNFPDLIAHASGARKPRRRRLSLPSSHAALLGDPPGSQIQERVKPAPHDAGAPDVLGHVERHLVLRLAGRRHAQHWRPGRPCVSGGFSGHW